MTITLWTGIIQCETNTYNVKQNKFVLKMTAVFIHNIYLWLVSQTVQPRQFRQFGEAPVIDAEVQVFIQDTEVLVAALYNPTTTLQE